MRYCRQCGSRLDDFDSFCSNCGAKVEEREHIDFNDEDRVENVGSQRSSVEDSINNVTDTVTENTESFLCFLLGILSVTCGTFICAIISLIFGKKAIEKGQVADSKCATFCKVGKICSIVSIALTGVGIALSAICWIIPLIFGLSFGILG